MMRTFVKPALSINDQVNLLIARGLVVGNPAAAEHALQHISYYRLRAYWLYFETDPQNPNHPLRAGTTLDQIIALYEFDRKLRLLLLDAIERIEIAARGSWAYRMAMAHGSHGYLKPSLYRERKQFDSNYRNLVGDIERSKETFIEHYKETYDDPVMPPVWMAAELMTLGLLSKWQNGLAKRADVVAIARPFQLDHKVYLGFIHHLATIRNSCAHHGRVWNRRLTVTTPTPAAPPDLAATVQGAADRRIYVTLAIVIHILRIVSPGSDWKNRLIDLLNSHPTNDLGAMGFPADWSVRPLWQP
jgi:abortive infection bacteriophage resistance protein